MTDELTVGQAVRFIGGKYNGFEGQIAKLCDTQCSVLVQYEGRTSELIEETRHLMPMELWQAMKTATELALKGHAQT